ncbi:olfactory receptor 8D1-like [Spea bombifrons]|uniref:olfactory receptor 8D1-like n=1 Tax=Spea bombifrons TaxID=233779 RepID=UPI00234A6CCD|nr:olfactory receptor 8D1-like [Spea bombifrons]
MERNNQTFAYLILEGISKTPELQLPVFLLLLTIYLTTLGGNLLIFLVACLDPHLQTPMYFFLRNLSLVDVCYSSDTLLGALLAFMSGRNAVSFPSCMAQLYCFMSLVAIEISILTAMSYDRYVAVCSPLRYQAVMSGRVCVTLASVCWALGFVEAVPYISIYAGFSCFKSNRVNHFFCDLSALMDISCDDTAFLRNVVFYESIFSGFIPFFLTFLSYSYIIGAVAAVRSQPGRRKAFYTCGSHLTVVALFYVTLFCQYLKAAPPAPDSGKFLSLLYTALVPMLNPLIYSLKNKDVKSALRRGLSKAKTRRRHPRGPTRLTTRG